MLHDTQKHREDWVPRGLSRSMWRFVYGECESWKWRWVVGQVDNNFYQFFQGVPGDGGVDLWGWRTPWQSWHGELGVRGRGSGVKRSFAPGSR